MYLQISCAKHGPFCLDSRCVTGGGTDALKRKCRHFDVIYVIGHWLHRKLSKWQLSLQPLMKISWKWHFRPCVTKWQLPLHMMTSSNGIIFRFTGLLWGEPPVTGGFPSQRPVTRSFDVFFDLRLNKRLSKQSRRRWFETQSRSLWRHCNEPVTHEDIPMRIFIRYNG